MISVSSKKVGVHPCGLEASREDLSSLKKQKKNAIDILDLPLEVMILILSRLNFRDKLSCTLVCSVWYRYLQIPALSKNMVFRFHDVHLEKQIPPFSTFENTSRILANIDLSFFLGQLNRMSIKDVENFLSRVGHGTLHLKISNLEPLEKYGRRILQCFPGLKKLETDLFVETLQCFEDLPPTLNDIHVAFVSVGVSKKFLAFLESQKELKSLTADTVVGFSVGQETFLNLAPELQKSLFLRTLEPVNFLKIKQLECRQVKSSYLYPGAMPETIAKLNLDGFTFRKLSLLTAGPLLNVREVNLANFKAKDICRLCIGEFKRFCPNVEKLEISNSDWKIFYPFVSAFTSLKELRINFSPQEICLSHIIFQRTACLANLTKLEIKGVFLDRFELIIWPFMIHLEDLHLEATNPQSYTHVEMLTMACPNVRVFNFNSTISFYQMTLFLERWNLKEFMFSVEDEQTVTFTKQLLGILTTFCSELRVLGIKNINLTGESLQAFQNDLFENVPTLRKFCGVSDECIFAYRNFQRSKRWD